MSRLIRVAGAAMAAALAVAAAPAWADCGISALTVPVTMVGLTPVVTARINGQEVKLILDSGAYSSTINADFAAERKLQAAASLHVGSLLPTQDERLLSGVAGRERVSAVVTADIMFGGTAFPKVPLLTTVNLTKVSGLLGQNFLHILDDEYDLGHGTMKMVKTRDCKTSNLAYWTKDGEPLSIIPLDTRTDDRRRTMAMVLVNGVSMRAMFDTGAAGSFITQPAAARAGVKTTDPGVEPAGEMQGLDSDHIKTWIARFATVNIGQEEIRNGILRIGESRADDFDILIGADFFLSHHVYVANSQGRIYFTYNGGQVFHGKD